MQEKPPDDRSPMAVAMEWSARITTIGLEMALPATGGFLLDRQTGTLPLFLVLGSMAGFAISIYHIVQLAQSLSQKDK